MLLDIGLPVMDGYEVARRLRAGETPAHPMRLLAVTGYGQAEDRRHAREAGFEHHLVKPIDLEELEKILAAVEDVLRLGAAYLRLTARCRFSL